MNVRLQHQRRLENFRRKVFQSLITTPADVDSDGVILPEACYIGVSSGIGVSAGQISVETSTGRSLSTPNLAANQVWRIGFFEKGVKITPSLSVAGTVKIHYLDVRRTPHIIASGDF